MTARTAARGVWLDGTDRASLTGAVADVVRLVVDVSAGDPVVGLPADPAADDVDRLVRRLERDLAGGRIELLTLRDAADRAVACVVLSRPATRNQHHVGELSMGAVDPRHRGTGLVDALFRGILARCAEHGIELLRLDVREGIRAERLWRAYGFRQYGRLEDYGRVDGRSYAGVYLAQPVENLRERIERGDDR